MTSYSCWLLNVSNKWLTNCCLLIKDIITKFLRKKKLRPSFLKKDGKSMWFIALCHIFFFNHIFRKKGCEMELDLPYLVLLPQHKTMIHFRRIILLWLMKDVYCVKIFGLKKIPDMRLRMFSPLLWKNIMEQTLQSHLMDIHLLVYKRHKIWERLRFLKIDNCTNIMIKRN